MESDEIIAKSKTTNLKIKVSYTDKHITKGTVLIGDAFNKVGAFDYWSTSTLTFEEMKKIKAVCINNSMSCQDDFTIGKTYKVKQCEDGLYELKDNDGWKWVVGENDFNHNFIEYKEDELLFIDGLIQFNKDKIKKSIDKFNIPKHYDNSKGTLYQVATERGWNAYLFDIVKRLERAEKKGEFKTDLEKSKVVIDLWLKESER